MKYSKGFTIVSLLVASAIGIFIAGVAGKIYVDSKTAFNMRTAVAATNENGRFAVEDLRRTLVMAGRAITSSSDTIDAYNTTDDGRRTFPDVAADGALQAGVIMNRDSNSGDASVGSSVIAIRYAEGPSCGGLITSLSTIRFYVNANNELVCEVTVGTGTPNPQPIVSGVERMRALYGVDTDADGHANRYLTATQVTGGAFWPNVVSIRIGLLVSSGEFQIPGIYQRETANTYTLLGMNVTAPTTDTFYKSITTTISLRNLHTTVERQ